METVYLLCASIIRCHMFPAAAAIVSATDAATYRLPDSQLLLITALLAASDVLSRPARIPVQLLAAGTAFIIFYCIYRAAGGLGFGDVKYAAVLGYALGFRLWFAAAFIAVFAALFAALAGMALRGWNTRTRIPFGPFLSIGAFAAPIAVRFCGL